MKNLSNSEAELKKCCLEKKRVSIWKSFKGKFILRFELL